MKELVEMVLKFVFHKLIMFLLSPTHIERDGLGVGLQEVTEQSPSNASLVMQDPKGYH
jgi:hypothetical protein